MENAVYSDDTSNILLPTWYGEKKNVDVPVDLVDMVIASGLSLRDLESALLFRRVTANGSPKWFAVQDLVGVDLTGKVVYIFYRNYEDSEWLSSNDVVGVRSENNRYYSFIFAGEQNINDDGEDDDENSVYNPMKNYSVSDFERVLVVTPNI